MILELKIRLPDGETRRVHLDGQRMLVGSLLSNQIVLRLEGVDPIHALIEQVEHDNDWRILDLDSESGVKLNGTRIDVEAPLHVGDVVEIASARCEVAEATIPEEELVVEEQSDATKEPSGISTRRAPPPAVLPTVTTAQVSASSLDDEPAKSLMGQPLSNHAADFNIDQKQADEEATLAEELSKEPSIPVEQTPAPEKPSERASTVTSGERRKSRLFSPRTARPSGNVLEVVAYWGDTVLEVDHFHQKLKGFERALIGSSNKAHFISAGPKDYKEYPLAEARDGKFKLNLSSGMEARIRRSGKVEKVKGKKGVSLGKRDLAHVKYGPVNYFLMNIRPPRLVLPKTGISDPFLMMLSVASMAVFLGLIVIILAIDPHAEDKRNSDLIAFVNLPDELKDKLLKQRPKLPKIKKIIPKIRVTPPKPPKPKKAEDFKPTKTNAPKKPPKVSKKKVEQRPTVSVDPTKGRQSKAPTGAKKPKKNQGMPSTGAKKPDFKLAGAKDKSKKLGAAGGVKGSGNGARGGKRKGNTNADYKGVEGVKNKKASGVNLSQLGLGAGKVLNKSGPGAIRVPFKDTAGGAGGGAGSAKKNYGLGGSGESSTVGVAGSGTGINNFGSGSGGFNSGQGGTGGLGGAGTGRGTGRGRAKVNVAAGVPGVQGGLTSEEIRGVIVANLNQIRACYETHLQSNPGASGSVKVKFKISLNGRVSGSSITSSNIPAINGCIRGKIRRWDFPKPRGGEPVNVTYPFNFSPA